MSRLDIYQQLADYRGVLRWLSGTTYNNNGWINLPQIDVPLFIKDHPIPIRKPKPTEINTIPNRDPLSGYDTTWGAVIFGTPDVLQMQLTGWIITPTLNNRFVPTNAAGSALNLGNISYTEIITAFIEGRLNTNEKDAWQRRDPDQYITPHGHNYYRPTILSWDPQYTVNMRKQSFTMTLALEK